MKPIQLLIISAIFGFFAIIGDQSAYQVEKKIYILNDKIETLEEELIESLQTQIDVDEADEDYIPLIQQESNTSDQNSLSDEEVSQESEEPEQKQMTEEELLKAIEDNLNDKKNTRRSF